MSRLREEMRVIPWPAWLVAVLAYAGLVVFFVTFVLQQKPEPASWPLWGKVLFTVCVPLPVTILVLVIGYVYGDAKRRGMRYVLWTLLAIFIPNAIGIILYFILRDPLLIPCPACGVPARGSFAFCPRCGAALAPACAQCRRPVEAGWSNCAYCGTKLA